MDAVPNDTPVTWPCAFTVATSEADDVQAIVRPGTTAPLDVRGTALKALDAPGPTDTAVADNWTLATIGVPGPAASLHATSAVSSASDPKMRVMFSS
jgi:hypothetical protein